MPYMETNVTPTPWEDRVRVLDATPTGELVLRYRALGNIYGAENMSKDELISAILEVEQEKGLVAK